MKLSFNVWNAKHPLKVRRRKTKKNLAFCIEKEKSFLGDSIMREDSLNVIYCFALLKMQFRDKRS